MINIKLLNEMLENKYVSVQKHPEANLFIYNYTPKAQYDKVWNEITLQCRGLILDENYNIISRPFKKFFNIEEVDINDIPKTGFDVYEKLDGSLGISYFINNETFISTRGSFTSEQAIHATNLLHSKYKHTLNLFNKDYTYLFEIIYPKNRIVIDYGEKNDIILLAVIDNKTGLDIILPDIGFEKVKHYDGINDIFILKNLEENNKEGFVVKFENGYRLKVKFEDYKRLHKIITGVSNIVIWEYLKDKKSFDELLVKVPDEFYNWLLITKNELIDNYNKVYDEVYKLYDLLYRENKKDFALNILDKAKSYSSLLFAIYDGKDIEQLIWKRIRPIFAKPFKTDDDN